MPVVDLVEKMNSDVPKHDAYVFLVFENSVNISKETLTTLNRAMMDFFRAFSVVENSTDMQVKIIAMEFDDKCRFIAKCGPVYVNEFSPLDIKPSNKVPDFGNMLCVLNYVIKDYCNESFTKRSFYAPIFIFVTVGPKDEEYLSALDSLNANKVYKYGTKIAFAVENEDNIERIADIVGTAEAVISKDNLMPASRHLRFRWIEVEPLLD